MSTKLINHEKYYQYLTLNHLNFNSYANFHKRRSSLIVSRRCVNVKFDQQIFIIVLGVVKRNPLFFHSIACKNNGFLFTTPNIIQLS